MTTFVPGPGGGDLVIINGGGGGATVDGPPKMAAADIGYLPPSAREKVQHPGSFGTTGFVWARDAADLLERGGLPSVQWSYERGVAMVTIVPGIGPWSGFKQAAGQTYALAVIPVSGLLAGREHLFHEWQIEFPFKLGADLSTLNDFVIFNIYGGQQQLGLYKASGFLQLRLGRNSAHNIDGGGNNAVVAQFAVSNGDFPADVFHNVIVSYDGTTLRLATGDDAHVATVTVTDDVRPFFWESGGRGRYSTAMIIGGAEGGGASPVQDLVVGPVSFRRWSNQATSTTVTRKPHPTITVDTDGDEGLHDFRPGVVDHYAGFAADGSGTNGPVAIKQVQILRDAGINFVRHAGLPILAPPTVDGGGNITSIDYTAMDADMDMFATCDKLINVFRTPNRLAGLTGTGETTLLPTDYSKGAQYFSMLATHIKARYPGRKIYFAYWNEPEMGGFYSGTRTALVDYWAVVAARFATDHPDTPLGGIDGLFHFATGDNGIDDYHTMKAIIDKAEALDLPLPHAAAHIYENDFTFSYQGLKSIVDYAAAHGFPDFRVLNGEWCYDVYNSAIQITNDTYGWYSNEPDRLRVEAGAVVYAALSWHANHPEIFTGGSCYYGFNSGPTESMDGYGMIGEEVNPRPFVTVGAHQVMCLHGIGDRILTLTPSNWPGVRAFETINDDTGVITVSYGTMRWWEKTKKTAVRFDWLGSGLPTTFTWERWEPGNEADSRLVLTATGDQDSLPLGLMLDGTTFGAIQITPS
jgi:hypothetical protein